MLQEAAQRGAQVDDDWASAGSNNLDPQSLAPNLEANVVPRDRGFASQLRERLQFLIRHSGEEVQPEPAPRRHARHAEGRGRQIPTIALRQLPKGHSTGPLCPGDRNCDLFNSSELALCQIVTTTPGMECIRHLD